MDYDIVVTGLGCSGLSFVYHLLNSPLKNQTILLIDNDPKQQNDRTWCYWSEEPLDIHPKSVPTIFWNKISLSNGAHSVDKSIGNLKYFQIKSSDFYSSILEKIRSKNNITWILDSVIDIPIVDGMAVVETSKNGIIKGKKIFNSIPFISKTQIPHLRQVFLGWEIESKTPCFDPKKVTLMDFDPFIGEETAFVYILPFNDKRGLVEYTVFTREKKIDKAFFISKLTNYIKTTLGVEDYKIIFREEGSIPMTTKNLNKHPKHPNLISLGSIAGCTKPSTGYTFHTIQKHTKKVIASLVDETNPNSTKFDWARKVRFSFYDNILLNVACKWPSELPHLFQDLFQKNKGEDILRFLNEETTFLQEVSILVRLRFKIFIKSLLNYESH